MRWDSTPSKPGTSRPGWPCSRLARSSEPVTAPRNCRTFFRVGRPPSCRRTRRLTLDRFPQPCHYGLVERNLLGCVPSDAHKSCNFGNSFEVRTFESAEAPAELLNRPPRLAFREDEEPHRVHRTIWSVPVLEANDDSTRGSRMDHENACRATLRHLLVVVTNADHDQPAWTQLRVHRRENPMYIVVGQHVGYGVVARHHHIKEPVD